MSDNKKFDITESGILIIFDTNVWLDLYKLPPAALISIIEAINNHLDKFWLPNQVYVEFNRHIKKSRNEAIGRYKRIKDESCSLLSDVKNKINQEFENLKRNNIFEAQQAQETFKTKMIEVISQIKKDLVDLDTEYQNNISCISDKDIIQDLIEKLYIQTNSKGFSINQLIRIYEEGEIRYKYKVPPGYTDIKKENLQSDNDFLFRKYGDLILWKEILQHVQGTERKLIFIQNEKKSDWWQSPIIRKLAQVLIEEYQEATSNKGAVEMIDFEQLLNIYGEQLNLPATTVKDIVAKLKLERDVCKYINDTKNTLIEDYIHQTYEEESRVYELLKDVSVFGGTFESVENVEVVNINIIDTFFDYDKDWELSYIGAEAEISCSGDITEYANKYVCHSGNVSMKIRSTITLDFSINFSDLEAEAKDAYEITDYAITGEEIKELTHDEYSIDVDVDEDMFRER